LNLSHPDAEKWNTRYRAGEHDRFEPVQVLSDYSHLLPRQGEALDLACGTGASAVQVVPSIAPQVGKLAVFQRTASYSVPAMNGPLDPEYEARVKADYAAFRARNSQQINAFGSNMPRSKLSVHDLSPRERREALEARWQHGGLFFLGAFGDFLLDRAANDMAAEFVREKIRGIVRDPAVAETLLPRGYPIGTKRMCVDTDYYATFNRDNVTLVDVKKNPIEAITPKGVQVAGVEYAVDDLVFATGFDAMTGALLNIDIRGRGGRNLAAEWAGGPRTYLGLTVAGFPNLFMITGPGSPSVLSNMIVSIEQHVDWIADCVSHLRARGLATIEATAEAQEAWVQHVNDVGHMTLYPLAPSWYMGANIPGKPRVFMPYIGGVGVYRQKCDEVAAKGYEGFALGA